MTRRRAFTLIELLAASALAAVLTLVIVQVIGSLGRAKAALARGEAGGAATAAAQSAWKTDLLDAVRWDLANADAAKFETDRVVLTGHGALDRRTLAASHEPVTVTYAIERRGGRGGRTRLVRHQAPRGGTTNDRGWSEVVCAGASGLTVQPQQSAGPLGLRRDPLAGPLRVRLDGPGGALIDEVVLVR